MAVILSARAELLSRNISKKPQIILEIEGIDNIFAINPVFKFATWDDPNINWDDPEVNWDGLVQNTDAFQYISLTGTSKDISQQLRPDKGVAAVSVFNIEIVDKYSQVSKLLSFDNITEILGRKAVVYFGFSGAAHPDDSVPILRGYIDEFQSGNGAVNISVSHPANLQRQSIFFEHKSQLTAAIDSVTQTIPLTTTVNLFEEQDALTPYIRIDDEIMEVISIDSATQITVNRGQLETLANSHDDEGEVSSIWRLRGNPIDLALKIMLSNDNNSSSTTTEMPRSIRLISPADDIESAIIFEHYNIEDFLGLVVGDSITLAGTVNAGTYQVTGFGIFETGSFILVNASLIQEGDYTGTFEYKSQFNTLPIGFGLGMSTTEVDVKGHLNIQSIFFTSFVGYDFRITEQIENASDFISQEIFYPQGLYSLPRKARVSVKMTNPPFSSEVLPILNTRNIISPEKLKQHRTTHREYYNNYLYKFNFDLIADKFLEGRLLIDEGSRAKFKVGYKQFLIESMGLRRSNETENMIEIVSSRYIDRYSNAPVTIENIEVLYQDGIKIEVGDSIPFGGDDVKLNELETGRRGVSLKLYEVKNKSLNITNAKVKLSLSQTNFGLNDRYAVISMGSDIGDGSTTTKIKINKTLDTGEFLNEWQKWEPYFGLAVVIRSDDYSYYEESILQGVDPQNNSFLVLDVALPSAPLEGYIIELVNYQDDDIESGALYKINFVHLTAQEEITSVASDSEFDVLDASRLFVGSQVFVHSEDYTRDSFTQKLTIESIVSNTVTLSSALSFTPLVGDFLERSSFLDGGAPYLIL